MHLSADSTMKTLAWLTCPCRNIIMCRLRWLPNYENIYTPYSNEFYGTERLDS